MAVLRGVASDISKSIADMLYARLDGTNQPFTGIVTVQGVATLESYTNIVGDSADIALIGKNNQMLDFIDEPVVQGTDIIAVGHHLTVKTSSGADDDIVNIGVGNVSQGTNAVAVGIDNIAGQVFNSGGIAVGRNCVAAQATDVALGLGSTATGSGNSVAVGTSAFASEGGIVVGNGTANQPASSAIGSTNTASAADATAVGRGNTASGINSGAIGISNTASSSNAIAIGASNNGGGLNIGRNNTVSGNVGIGANNIGNAFAIGSGNNATNGGTAVGASNTSSASVSAAVGLNCTASALASIAIGYFNTASATSATAMGLGCTANQSSATAMGSACQATVANGLAIGRNVRASGTNAAHLGWTAAASDNNVANTMRISYTTTNTIVMSATNTVLSVPITLKGYTVATLPAGVEGMRAYVTDATAPTYLGALTGGGAVKCPVFYNGTAWVSA